jgi:hypothetical protein
VKRYVILLIIDCKNATKVQDKSKRKKANSGGGSKDLTFCTAMRWKGYVDSYVE